MTDIGTAVTAALAAAELDGDEYREEGSPDLFARMKDAGLVAVFGASDDLMEFRGAIDDEISAYDGTTAYLTTEGLLANKCDNDDCPYFRAEKRGAATIDAKWCDGDVAWTYETAIPHARFTINDEGDPYCIGIVFALKDVP